MSGIEVRQAQPSDHQALVALLVEMERFYEGPRAIDRAAAAARLESAMATLSDCEILIATLDGRPAGLASFSTLFPSDALERQFFLKDLFVVQASRGMGVGRALMQTLARLARDRGIIRIDWTTGADNRQARALYDGIGAELRRDMVYYRLERAALTRLARADDGR
jgi:GNAT superfamily N-acetyltransferase